MLLCDIAFKWKSEGAADYETLSLQVLKLIEANEKRCFKASTRGLEVKAEDSLPRGPGFKPPLWRPFFRHHSFRSKLGTKIVANSNLALLHML